MPAPPFRLSSGLSETVSLSDFRGKNLVLVFYPADWSPVCGDQLALYNEVVADIRDLDADLVAVSVDGIWCHKAFAENRKFHFSLLSDFEPKGAVANSYGAYREKEGFAERALFVIDSKGVIAWSYLSPVDVNPGANGILEALEKLGSSRWSEYEANL
jgi:peroxiredoxin